MSRTFVIVGASLAGVSAAQTLRDEGFDGRVVLIGEEARPPYERPELSKGYLRGERRVEDLVARGSDWFADNDVELRTGVRVAGLDPSARTVELADGGTVAFDRALIATGARNRRLDVPGHDLPGVLALRTIEEADAIREAIAGGGRAVVVGMGFIGAEVAASLRRLGVEVTVVEVFETAMWRVLGAQGGRVLEGVHRDHGVTMRFGDAVDAFEGAGRLERVVTSTGARLEGFAAVVGAGVVPAVELWPLTLAHDGGIPVGPALETEVPGVFAAGDVASHRHPYLGTMRVEHYDNAIRMGEAAARGMLGAAVAYDDPHWFWSEQYDVRIEMVGHPPPDATVIMRGSYDEAAFCAFHLDGGGVLRAAVSVGWPRDVRRAARLVRSQARPDPAALADPDVDLRSLS